MKYRSLFLVILFSSIMLACYGQPTIVYTDKPILSWDEITTDDTGHPLLPEDHVDYLVYIWDESKGTIADQLVSALTPVGTATINEMPLVFPYKGKWSGAVRARLTNARGDIFLAPMAYTTDPAPVTAPGPFVYAPTNWILQKVQNLKNILKP